ncbi:MAG: hypothetical protein NTV34_07765 [Proteobacteria bacterium]|nr:hypothetical protein [Pseudomonadota bacterium]
MRYFIALALSLSPIAVSAQTSASETQYACLNADDNQNDSTVMRIFVGDEGSFVSLKASKHSAKRLQLKQYAVVEVLDPMSENPSEPVDWYTLAATQFKISPTDGGILFKDAHADKTYVCGLEQEVFANPAKSISN